MNATRPPSSAPFGESDGGRPATPGFGPVWLLVGLVVVVALVAGLAWSAATGEATPADHPQLFGGSRVLDDTRQLTVVDLATGLGTVQLSQVNTDVGAAKYADVEAVPVSDGTFLVNRVTGRFNLLASDNYVIDTSGGVGLGALQGSAAAAGFAVGADAFIVRYAARSTVSLVDQATVQQAAISSAGSATAQTTVLPRGFAALPGRVPQRAGATAVAAGDLWTLVEQGPTCSLLQLHPVPTGHRGLLPTTRATDLDCATTTLAGAGATLGLATPGHVELLRSSGGTRPAAVAATSSATSLLAVSNLSTTLWWVARNPSGWSAFGVTPDGRVTATRPLRGIPASAVLTVPAYSEGHLYTLDEQAAGQPDLWVVDPSTGAVGTVAGASTYPAKSRAEQADFGAAEAIGVGPRVIFNNPDSLLAVMVFTDGSRGPVIVDKSSAVAVSATGPAEVDAKPPARHGTKKVTARPQPRRQTPASAPAFSQQVSCQDTTEKPYAPRITAVSSSSEAALVTWTYQLLDPQDCEPDTWTVHVTALGGAPQPGHATLLINGQSQLEIPGLRPTTHYEVIVTAHINSRSTPSVAVPFTTGRQGPDAPTAVTTSVDSRGDWVVSWTRCQAATCYVPADDWVVTGSACGSGFVGTPPTTEVSGDRTTVTVPAGNLLGASLSFDVHGVLANGLEGNPTGDGSCTQAWHPPQPAGISLAASAVAVGRTVTATLQVEPAPGAASATVYGTDDTSLVFHLGGVTYGPTTSATETIRGLTPGQSYLPSVTVYPTGHPDAAVVVDGPQLHRDLAWPGRVTASAAVLPAVDGHPDMGLSELTFAGLPAGHFTVVGTLECGSIAIPINAPLTGATAPLPSVDLRTNAPTCTASQLSVHDTTTPSPYGNVARPVGDAAFRFPAPVPYQYLVSYVQHCQVIRLECTDNVTVTQVDQNPVPGANWVIKLDQQDAPVQCAASNTYAADPLQATFTLTHCPQTTVQHPLLATVSWTLYDTAQFGEVTIRGTPGTTPTTGSTSTTTSTTAPDSTSSTTTDPPGSAPAAAGGRVGPAALAAVTVPIGAAGTDSSGRIATEAILGGLVLAGAGLGWHRRRRRGRPPRLPDTT